jgi:branched-chain amino acid transport system ATP-binding protein
MTPRLKLEHVSVQFAGLRAVSDVSFDVAPGEICAVIGPNGAGKSTLFNAIGGYVRATGHVYLNDTLLSGKSVHQIAATGVRRTFQNGGLFLDLTVIENVVVGLHRAITCRLSQAPSRCLPPGGWRRRRSARRVSCSISWGY